MTEERLREMAEEWHQLGHGLVHIPYIENAKELRVHADELAALRKDRERLDWLEDRKTIMVHTLRLSECTGEVKELLTERCDQQRKTLREAIDVAMTEGTGGK